MSKDEPEETGANLQLVGLGFIGLGSCFLVFMAALVIAHYGFGAPVHMRRSGGLAPEGGLAFAILFFVAAGAGMVFAGIRMRRAAGRMFGEE
ncbi:hypothetical protein [Sphingomonas sp.]|uniref:hypothetical protein n=1 Tax=Sphingomonas sp. TaxID=28214 RepID=UPI001B2F5DA3|nr:hypothetical protein [Sphingomonas sp.]MBO9713174.1 hypothetical protein [Sphingomonas sp.]